MQKLKVYYFLGKIYENLRNVGVGKDFLDRTQRAW